MRSRLRRLGRPRELAVLGLLVVVGLAWLGPLGSYATRDRGVITANPGLRPFNSVVQFPLDPGEQACVSPVPYEERTGKAIFAAIAKRGSAELTVTAEAPGFRAQGSTRTIATTGAPETLEAEFDEPGRDVIGRLCWQNTGTRPVALVGTDEAKSIGPAESTVQGRRVRGDIQLTIAEVEHRSLADRPAQLVERVAAISGLWQWVVWLLLLAVLVGFPGGAAFALYRSIADEELAAAPPEPPSPPVTPSVQRGSQGFRRPRP